MKTPTSGQIAFGRALVVGAAAASLVALTACSHSTAQPASPAPVTTTSEYSTLPMPPPVVIRCGEVPPTVTDQARLPLSVTLKARATGSGVETVFTITVRTRNAPVAVQMNPADPIAILVRNGRVVALQPPVPPTPRPAMASAWMMADGPFVEHLPSITQACHGFSLDHLPRTGVTAMVMMVNPNKPTSRNNSTQHFVIAAPLG